MLVAIKLLFDPNLIRKVFMSVDKDVSSPKRTGKIEDAAKLDINNLPDLLTVKEVANLLRVSPLTVKRWGARGKLSAIRINSRGDRRYKKEAVLWMLGVETPQE